MRASGAHAFSATAALSISTALAVVAALVLPVKGAETSTGRQSLAAATQSARHVVVISIDGLNPDAINVRRTPAIVRLKRNGASTYNARTEHESTRTLPNHTGMVTGRRVQRTTGGHGVTWNDSRLTPRTVQRAAGHSVASVFTVLDDHRRSAALFVSKEKLRIFDRSWGAGVDRFTRRIDNHRLMTLAIQDLVARRRGLTFVHLSAPDAVGHARGFMSAAYLRAVSRTDAEVGRLVGALDRRPGLKQDVAVVLTADHGGRGHNHSDRTLRANHRIPFIAWGAGVGAGKDLYELNPEYADPGSTNPGYAAARQPIRNGAVANVSLDLLGLSAVRGSEHNRAHNLAVR